MKNLSLVIQSNSEFLFGYIRDFELLLNDFDTELIIINNELDKLDIPYKHIIYKYDETYEKFRDFCYSICTGENIIIIEEGMFFDKEIIELIKKSISSMQVSIFCNIKRFLSRDKKRFTISKFEICKNISNNFEKYIDNTIEDESLLLGNQDSINKVLALFSTETTYENIYVWYEAFVLNNNKAYILKFYELLERKKIEISYDIVKLIENMFLDSNSNSKYSSYLKIKANYDNVDNKAVLINEIRNLDLCEEDTYFCYFLLNVFRDKNMVIEIFNIIKISTVNKYLEYLFIHEKEFYLFAYEFLISVNLNKEISISNNINIDFYSKLSKCYIKYMSERSETFENKQKLIQVFIDYTNYGFYLVNRLKRQGRKLILNTEMKFLLEIDKTINLINLNKIDEAVNILKNATLGFPEMSRPVEYYIQRLRLENKKYPYKISICMIIKDEEKNIERCLKSLKPLVDIGLAEFVVVDTGSTDKTVEIAQGYVGKIHHHQWQGNFSEARNYNISLAQGEYIFIMDADEEIEEIELTKIINIFKSEDYCNYNTFSFKIKNYSDVGYKKFSIFTQNLIFRNDGTFYYLGSVHNQPVYKQPIKHIDCTVLHYGYIMTSDIKDKKFIRTATMLKKELEKNPKSIYYRFQLSVSYSMHGDLQESLEQTKIYMKILKEKQESIADNLMYYNNAALVYTNNLLYDEAIDICNETLAVQPDFIDFIFYKGDGLFEKKEYEEAIIYLKEYLELIEDFHNHDVMHDDRYLFYTLDSKEIVKGMLTVAYNKTFQYEKCLEQVYNIKDNKVLKNALYVVIDSFIKLKNKDAIIKFYEEIIYNHSENEIKEVFKYYFEDYLLNASDEEQKEYIIAFAKSGLDDDYIDVLRFRAGNNILQNTQRVLHFIDKYDINETDSVSGNMIIETILPIVKDYKFNSCTDIVEIKNVKTSTEFILHRTLNLKQYNSLKKEELLLILDKYINACIYLISQGKEEFLETNEIAFISNILNAFEELNKNNLVKCIGFIRDSVLEHKKMAKAMELFLETIVPGYKIQ